MRDNELNTIIENFQDINEISENHWSDNDDRSEKKINGYYINHNGKPIYYKDDYID